MSTDLYAVVGVSSNATQKEIAKAFRAKARVLHPDKQPPGASEAAKLRAKKAFQELVGAYEVLTDEGKRASYNLSRPAAGGGVAGAGASGARAGARYAESDQPRARPQPQGGGRRPQARPAPPQSGGRRSESYAAPRDRRPPARPPTSYDDREEEDYYPEFKKPTVDEDYMKRKAEEEQERERRHGLGGHWVKPPTLSAKQRSEWTGWSKSGAAKSAAAPARCDPDGSDSDASSVLSFNINIGIDLKNLDLGDFQVVDDDPMNGYGGGEVWTFHQEPTPAPSQPKDSAGEGDAGEEAGKSTSKRRSDRDLRQPRPCCAVQ